MPQIAFNGNGIVMLLVPGGEYQRDRRMHFEDFPQFRHRSPLAAQFSEIALLEFRPFPGFMTEPLTQFGTGRDAPRPMVYAGLVPGESPRPDPIHEDAKAIRICGRGIYALEPEAMCHSRLLPAQREQKPDGQQ